MSNFCHLHVHTKYSLLDGLCNIKDLINKAKALGQESIAITDHGNMFGAVEFYKYAKEAGVKVLLGTILSDVIVEDGVIKLKDRSAFAGSIATADRLIRVVTDAGIPLYEAVKMLTKVPAEIMGLNKGVLAEGRDADIIVFDDGVNVKDIFVGGKKIV